MAIGAGRLLIEALNSNRGYPMGKWLTAALILAIGGLAVAAYLLATLFGFLP